MANYATNIFFASTENEKDLERVETFLDEHFCDCYIDCNEDYINAEFESRWDYPEISCQREQSSLLELPSAADIMQSLIDEMISSLEAKDEIYIRVLTHELCNEYVSFRVYSGGKWDIRV